MEYADLLEKHNILHFAASKGHIGLYPGPEAVLHFAKELQDYKTDKGTIRIPYGKVDAALIEKIAKWCWETGNHDVTRSFLKISWSILIEYIYDIFWYKLPFSTSPFGEN